MRPEDLVRFRHAHALEELLLARLRELFTRTANSRRAIGGEARHGHNRFNPPKNPIPHKEAHDLVLSLVRRWLAEQAPPKPPHEVVVGVRPAREGAASRSDEIT